MTQSGRRRRSTRQTFTYDQVGEVIKNATRLQQLADEQEGAGEVTMAQLREIASELRVSPEALAQAIATGDQEMETVRRRVRRKLRWFRHAGTYAAVMMGLAGIDLLADPAGLDWVFFPALGWGMFVAAHAARAFSGRGSALERRLLDREISRR